MKILQGLEFLFKNFVPIVWYVISAGVNFFGGWVLCSSLGLVGQIVGGCALLIVQFSLPYYEYQSKYQNRPYTIGKFLSWLVTLLCLVVTMSYVISTGISSTIQNSFDIKSEQVEIEANKLLLDNTTIPKDLDINVSNEQIQRLFSKVNSIQSFPAKNFAGDRVFLNGEAANIVDVTNDCTLTNTSMDVYMTDEKLYKSHCNEIDSLRNKIIILQKIAGEDSKEKILERSTQTSKELSSSITRIGKLMSDMINQNRLELYVLEDIDLSNTDPDYILSVKPLIDERSMTVALMIGVIGMLIEYCLMKAFIGQFFPNTKTNNFNTPPWIKGLLDRVSKLIATVFVFIFKNKKSDEEPTRDKEVFNAKQWLQNITLQDVMMIQDVKQLNSNKGSVSIDDIYSLQLATLRQYSPGESIPLKSTITTIKNKALTNEHYSKTISLTGKPLSNDEIDSIFKTNRLKKFFWEVFENTLLDKKDNKYYWKSEKDMELLYYKSKNH